MASAPLNWTDLAHSAAQIMIAKPQKKREPRIAAGSRSVEEKRNLSSFSLASSWSWTKTKISFSKKTTWPWYPLPWICFQTPSSWYRLLSSSSQMSSFSYPSPFSRCPTIWIWSTTKWISFWTPHHGSVFFRSSFRHGTRIYPDHPHGPTRLRAQRSAQGPRHNLQSVSRCNFLCSTNSGRNLPAQTTGQKG